MSLPTNTENSKISYQEAMEIAKNEMENMFIRVPYAREFHMGEATDKSYYSRHLIETILRIRLNNEVDAYCLYKICYKKLCFTYSGDI